MKVLSIAVAPAKYWKATSVILNRIQRGRRPPELTRLSAARSPGTSPPGVSTRWSSAPWLTAAVDGFLTELLGRPPAGAGGVAVWADTAVAPPPAGY